MINPPGRITTFNDIIDRLYDPSSFVERPWLVEEIIRFRDGERQHLIIVGEPGSGKSAFVAYLAEVWNCPRYFIRVDSIRSVSGISARAFLVSLGAQLYQKYGPDIFPRDRGTIAVWAGVTGQRAEVVGQFIDRLYTLPFLPLEHSVVLRSGIATGQAQVIGRKIGEVHDITLSLDEPTLFHVTFLAPLMKLHELAPNEQVVVLVDALDEATQHAGKSIIQVIPGIADTEFPPNLRLLITSRQGDHLAAFSSRDLLYLDDRSEGFLRSGRKDFRAYIDKRLNEEPIATAVAALRAEEVRELVIEIQNKSANNFLYLFHFFNEVEAMVRQGESLTTLPVPRGLDEIYRFFALQKIKGDINLHDWQEIYLPILGILAVAREPLGRKLLAALASVVVENVDFVIGKLGQFLDISNNEEANLYRLYHASFGEYLLDATRNRDWPLDAAKLHGRVADHFWPPHVSGGDVELKATDLDDYAYRNLAAHFLHADRLDQLHDLVANGESEVAWAEAHYRRFGSYLHYLEDLEVAWQAAANHSAELERRIRYTLIACSIRSLAGRLTADLLRHLGSTGLWRWEAVLAHTLQMPQVHQGEIFLQLIPWIPSDELDNALAAIDRLPTEHYRAEALRSLARNSLGRWSTDQAQKALALAEALRDEKLRGLTLAQLTVVMPDQVRIIAVRGALTTAASMADRYTSEIVWDEVLIFVPDDLKGEALSIAAEIGDEWTRGYALASLVTHMDGGVVPVIAKKILALKSHWTRAEGLARLLSQLPPAQRGWLPFRGLLLALSSKNPFDRYRVVAKFLPFLRRWIRDRVSSWTMARVHRIEDPRSRANVLIQLIEHLPEDQQPSAADQLFASVSQLTDPSARFQLLHEFMKRSPAPRKVTAANQAFTALDQVAGRLERFDRFALLVSDLPDALLPRAVEYLKSIDDRYQRERAFSSLAPRLLKTLLPEAKALILGTQDLLARGSLLTALARHPSAECRQWVVETAEAIPEDYWRGMAFVALAPVLKERVLDLVERAKRIKNDDARAQALVSILEFVPAERQSTLFRDALAATRAGHYSKTERLALLIAHAPLGEKKQLAGEALAISRLINDRQHLNKGLASLFGSLSGAAQSKLLDPLLLTMDHNGDTLERLQALRQVIEQLSPDASVETQRRLLAVVRESSDRDDLLYDLVPRIGDEIVEEVLAVLDHKDSFYRPLVLARLSRRLSGETRERVIGEAIELAKPSLNRWHAARILIEFADEVLTENALWNQALTAACDPDQVGGSKFITEEVRTLWLELASRLPVELVPSALESATKFAYPKLRAEVLCRLAAKIEASAAESIIRQALDPLQARLNEYEVQQWLISLTDDLMPAHIPDLVNTVQAIPDEHPRTQALIALAKQVAIQARHHVVQQAFEATRALSNEGWQAFALADLAPVLPSELLDSAFDIARAMKADNVKAVAYSALGARAPSHSRVASIARIRSVAKTLEGRWLAETLVNLSCYVDETQRIDVIRESLIVIGEQIMSWDRPEFYRRVMAAWKETGFGEGPLSGRQVLADALRALNHENRILLFESLPPLAPVFAHLGGVDTVREVFRSTNETRHWWP